MSLSKIIRTYYKENPPTKERHSYQEDFELLKSYVFGKIPIVDKTTGEETCIKKIEDLKLLAASNLLEKDENRKHINSELSRLHSRIQNKHEDYGLPSWIETLDKILNNPDIIEHLGSKANYNQHIKLEAGPKRHSYQEDFELLKSYVFGKIPIVDKTTGEETCIKKIEDLKLLATSNLLEKDENRKHINSELFRLRGRISNKHYLHKNYNWGETLDRIFQDNEIIKYFDQLVKYDEHVRLEPPKKLQKRERPMEEYIPLQLIPLWSSYKNNQDQDAKNELVEYYIEALCKKICNGILLKLPQIKKYYYSSDDLIDHTYQELIKRIELFDLTLGIKFETYAQKCIHGRVIDQLRKEKILCRKSQEGVKEMFIESNISKDENNIITLISILANSPNEVEEIDVDKLMEGMNPKQRIVFEGKIFEKKGYKQIKLEVGGVTLSRCSQLFTAAKQYIIKRYSELYD